MIVYLRQQLLLPVLFLFPKIINFIYDIYGYNSLFYDIYYLDNYKNGSFNYLNAV